MTTMEKNYSVLEYINKNQDLIYKPSHLGLNIAQTVRYARENGIKLNELTSEDIQKINHREE